MFIYTISVQKFAVAKKDTVGLNGNSVEKDDIGIIKNDHDTSSSIHFMRIGEIVELDNNDFDLFDAAQTGDLFRKKICNVCHKLLGTTEFPLNQTAKDNRPQRRPSCKKCRRTIEGLNLTNKLRKEWILNQPVPVPFVCPICLKTTIADVTSKVVIDHDHLSGQVRGWLCESCNTGLGRFKDDVTILKRAIEFLEKEPD